MPDDTCRYAGDDQPRILPGRHVDEDVLGADGLPVHEGDDCRGCQPCPRDHCIVCHVEHVEHEQTCPTCITNAKERLRTVYGLHKHLAAEALHGGQDGRLAAARPIPGGDATVLRGPGSTGGAVAWAEEYDRLATEAGLPLKDVTHKHDERRGEPMPTVLLFNQWEDVWRAQLGNPVEHRTMLSTTAFLAQHVSWAAQRTDSFPEFVRDIARHAALLEALLNDGIRPETGAAPCFRCAGDLERKAGEPEPCRHARLAKQAADHWGEPGFTTVHLLRYLERVYPDTLGLEHADCEQGGRADTYQCTRCHWRYPRGSYWLAVREEVDRLTAAKKKAKTTTADRAITFAKEQLEVELQPWQEDFMREHFSHATSTKETA